MTIVNYCLAGPTSLYGLDGKSDYKALLHLLANSYRIKSLEMKDSSLKSEI